MSNVNQSIVQSHLSAAQTQQSIQVSVAKKTLDAARQEGAAVLKLLESATQIAPAEVTLGAIVSGKGQRLDVSA
jgi:hypothetical protein